MDGADIGNVNEDLSTDTSKLSERITKPITGKDAPTSDSAHFMLYAFGRYMSTREPFLMQEYAKDFVNEKDAPNPT